jgi:cysteine synthase
MTTDLLDSIGKTPLLRLGRAVSAGGARIYAKLERFNPGGSIKDRTVAAMLEAAEKSGTLKKGMTIIEPVAGNTGVALALQCAIRGYHLILVMPEDYMPERRHILESLGTNIETTSAREGVQGAIKRVGTLSEEHPDYFMINHFENPIQVDAHRAGLMAEILVDLDEPIHAFVSCVGIGSTLTAAALTLKESGTQIIAVEPQAFPHAIQGIGFGMSPANLNGDSIDQTYSVSDAEAVQGFGELAAETGVLAGLSSGANYFVSKKLSHKLGEGKNIVTIFYDGGERYFSLKERINPSKEKVS